MLTFDGSIFSNSQNHNPLPQKSKHSLGFGANTHWQNERETDTEVYPEDKEPDMMKKYLDLLKKDIEANPDKLVYPDRKQEDELNELLRDVD
jgi:hypothetical protein